MRCTAAVVFLSALVTLAVLTTNIPGNAATPTTAPTTPSLTPTVTPIPRGTTALRVRVVDDRNANGIVDAGDVGLEGWRVVVACGDALSYAPDTNAHGVTYVEPRDRYTSEDGVRRTCAWVERQRGWLPTSPTLPRPSIVEGQTSDVTFLLRYLGDGVMETYVSIIRRGVPVTPALAGAPPNEVCVETVEEYPGLVFILGRSERPDCPQAGTEITILADGEQAGTIRYDPGVRESSGHAFVLRGDSMRLSLPWDDYPAPPGAVTAIVNGHDCGVVELRTSFAVAVQLYVLSDEARSGCGRPGDRVRLYRGGVALDPAISWQPGWQVEVPVFAALGAVITPPNTGTAGLASSR